MPSVSSHEAGPSSAATLLLQARATGVALIDLPFACRPGDAAAAYRIQDAISHELGPVGGWKVGAKGPDQEPHCAPIPARLVRHSPVRLTQADSRLRGVEAEIAVRLGRDLPARGRPYTAAELASAIDAVLPAIEVVDSRYVAIEGQDAWSLLADGASNAGLVLGQGLGAALPLDLARQRAQLCFDDRVVVDATGGNAAGDLLRLLTWLANHVGDRAGGLKAGQVVTTGSFTGLLFADPGTRVRAVIEGIGEVALSFS